jgi:hypothetical protein
MWAFGVNMEVLLALLITACATSRVPWPMVTKQPSFLTAGKSWKSCGAGPVTKKGGGANHD